MKNKVQFLCVIDKNNQLQFSVSQKNINNMKYIVFARLYGKEYSVHIVKPDELSPFSKSLYKERSVYRSVLIRKFSELQLELYYDKESGLIGYRICCYKRDPRTNSLKDIMYVKITYSQIERYIKVGCNMSKEYPLYIFDIKEFYDSYKSANNVKRKLLGVPYVGDIITISTGSVNGKISAVAIQLPYYTGEQIVYKELFLGVLDLVIYGSKKGKENLIVNYFFRNKEVYSLRESFIELRKQEMYYKKIKDKFCDM